MKVVEVLGKNHLEYSHTELESLLNKMDRVTLYRVLKDFEETGLVHKIIDMGGVTRFALCKHSCPDGNHSDNHVHFNCQDCNKVFCMDKIVVPELRMPKGYRAMGAHTLLYGLCSNCSAN